MNHKQLERIFRDRGFVAALDQSGGSTPRALELYGVPDTAYSGPEAMDDAVHAMRTRIMTSPVFFGDRILGVILFAATMRRSVEGRPTVEYLWKRKGIVPFLKVDEGLDERRDGVQLMRPMTALEDLLDEARIAGIFGTKMRSIIHEPNSRGIAEIMRQQFEVAAVIARKGLMPIIEPEVSLANPARAESEMLVKREAFRHLAGLPPDDRVMFKLTIPEEDDFYADLIHDPHVVRVIALSGGYTREEAVRRLARNHGMIASFSRALTEGLRVDQSEEEFNTALDASIEAIYQASIT